MNVGSITEKIISDAREAASQALREASERADMIRQESEATIEEQRNQAVSKARREGEELRERMLRMAELDQRKENLAMKRDIISEVFGEVIRMMTDMPPESARPYIKGLLLASADGDEEIIASARDQGLYDYSFLAEVNSALIASGRLGQLKLSPERRSLAGGFILIKGGVEKNCTFESIVEQMRPSLELDTANALFG